VECVFHLSSSPTKFLQTRIKPTPGKIVTSGGEVLGDHEGLAFYTIGQRSFGVTATKSLVIKGQDTKPLYVVGKNFASNELVVGFDTDPLLYKKEINLTQIHWISGQSPVFPLECEVRLRHRQPLQKCTVQEDGTAIKVTFTEPQRAPTPGQFAVFYLSSKEDKEGECLGGGVIENI
jgi:tRNA-specific 2-thiouridylase